MKVEYEIKGGGVTGILDTARFGLHLILHVTDYSEDKQKKALVQQTYRVTSPTSERMYTLNLYPTNNTVLLNGKNYDKFIEDHLSVILQIMCGAVQDQNLGSVANFNEILGTQMQKVLDE